MLGNYFYEQTLAGVRIEAGTVDVAYNTTNVVGTVSSEVSITVTGKQ